MEQVLLKMASKLRAFDEASLMALWDKYAETVQRFEPSQRWEEAVLVLSMIQGMRFKNQLFNHHWAKGRQPGESAEPAPMPALTDISAAPPAAVKPAGPKRQGKLLAFKPKDGGEA